MYKLFCAESCTAGLISGTLGAVSGASSLLWGGAVVYASQAKMQLTGISEGILATHGEVSEAAVEGMLQGILDRYPVTLSLVASGIAGPSGGSPKKPVGLVYLGVGIVRNKNRCLVIEKCNFSGDRNQVQNAAVGHGLGMLYRSITEEWPTTDA
ncbi:MAG: CinA family protein [Spirochaetales bacterium]|nr:CinA family protein [Spirochaetales bacterium]